MEFTDLPTTSELETLVKEYLPSHQPCYACALEAREKESPVQAYHVGDSLFIRPSSNSTSLLQIVQVCEIMNGGRRLRVKYFDRTEFEVVFIRDTLHHQD
jgi:hypothetical protein